MYEKNRIFRLRKLGDSNYVLTRGKCLKLNSSALFIYEKLGSGFSESEICEQLADIYDIGDMDITGVVSKTIASFLEFELFRKL